MNFISWEKFWVPGAEETFDLIFRIQLFIMLKLDNQKISNNHMEKYLDCMMEEVRLATQQEKSVKGSLVL